MQQVNLGIIGGGTVGGGVCDALKLNGALLSSRIGIKVNVIKIAVRSLKKNRTTKIPKNLLTEDWREVVFDPEVQIVAELAGGTTTAREVVLAALKLGQTRRHGEQSPAFRAWRGTFCCRKKIQRQSLLRSQRLRRHSHHQIIARRLCRQPHRCALWHRQRHLQLHSHAHETRRRGLRGSSRRRAKIGLCRNTARFGH
ncbi:MAG: hypothetical protein WDM76_09320 [Limisphaerales bacterium]